MRLIRRAERCPMWWVLVTHMLRPVRQGWMVPMHPFAIKRWRPIPQVKGSVDRWAWHLQLSDTSCSHEKSQRLAGRLID